MLTATGGNPGEDAPACRRPPMDGAARRRGPDPGSGRAIVDADTGDGVRPRADRLAPLGDDRGMDRRTRRDPRLTVERRRGPQAGETIDFVVDCRGDVSIATVQLGAGAPDGRSRTWSAEAEFAGPSEAPPERVWEKYAQVLLETNEFLFVD